MILVIFDLHIAPILSTKFQVSWPLGSGEQAQNRLLNLMAILDFWYERFLLFLNYKVALILPTKFWVNWPFSSREEAKRNNRFSRWWSSWISDQNDFIYFLSTSHPNMSYQDSGQLRGMFEMNCLFLSGDFKFQVSPKVLISCPRSTPRGQKCKVSADVSTSWRCHGTLIWA